ITDVDNEKTINVETGDIFNVKLTSTSGSGYSWHLNISDGLQLIDKNYSFDPQKYGGTRIQELRIKAVATGTQKVKGINKRFWEKETGKESTFTININVI